MALHDMLVNVLAMTLAGAAASAAASAAVPRALEEWLEGPSVPLNSTHLVDLVPLAKNPGFGLSRFRIEQMWKLYWGQGSKAPAPLFDFDEIAMPAPRDPSLAFKYGEILYYGAGCARNLTRAAEFYQEAAEQGHSEAQFMLGVAYSTGFFGNWQEDQAMATLYYTFSAINLSTRGLLAMGNRYLRGFHAPKDYRQAYDFYLNAANTCLEYYEDFQYAGHRYDPFVSFVTADEYDGGIFGKLNSEEHLRISALRDLFIAFDSVEEALDRIQFRAFEEDTALALQYLAQANQFGITTDGRPDFESAARFAETLVERTTGNSDPTKQHLESWALALLADCYRRAEARPFDLEEAKRLYKRALELAPPAEKFPDIKNCPQCYSGLGLIALYEMRDLDPTDTAAQILYANAHYQFRCGAKLSSPFSLYHVGNELYQQGYLTEAVEMFQKCNHMVPLAAYTLGLIYHNKYERTSAQGSLESAANQMLIACKRTEELYSPARWAHYAYNIDHEAALVGFAVAAELGSVAEQINVADILDVHHSALKHLPWLNAWPVPRYVKEARRAPLALKYYLRAAQAYSFDSLYKVAEYIYHGTATEKNISCAYKLQELLALDYGFPMAYWAIGWMQDHGIGVPQNFKSAKQFYESALMAGGAQASYFAARFSIAWLYIRWSLAKLSGVNVDTISPDFPKSAKGSWLAALRDARDRMKSPQVDAAPDAQALARGEGDQGAFLVDISIIAVVFTMFGILVWFRRRREQ